MKNRKSCYWG